MHSATACQIQILEKGQGFPEAMFICTTYCVLSREKERKRRLKEMAREEAREEKEQRKAMERAAKKQQEWERGGRERLKVRNSDVDHARCSMF
jgi:hypothetical protein